MLIDGNSTRANRRKRLFLFAAWLGLVSWLLATHVFWRDEVRAFSLALSGQTVGEMLRDIHGEGHPALWYLILRLCHEILPVREVLPAAGALIGIGAMALTTMTSVALARRRAPEDKPTAAPTGAA